MPSKTLSTSFQLKDAGAADVAVIRDELSRRRGGFPVPLAEAVRHALRAEARRMRGARRRKPTQDGDE